MDELEQHSAHSSLDAEPTHEELVAAVKRSRDEKACGEDRIPMEFWKAIIDSNKVFQAFYECVIRFWRPEDCPEEWLVGVLILLPKKEGLTDANNWRGIMLLNTLVKIVGNILSSRLQDLLTKIGLESQNRFMKMCGCIDGVFSLKVALKKRKEHGLDSWVAFVDLVKAFDRVPRGMLIHVLQKYGAPEKFCNLISRLHSGVKVKIRVAGKEVVIDSTVGVKQGDSLAPILFLIYMQACMEVYIIKIS